MRLLAASAALVLLAAPAASPDDLQRPTLQVGVLSGPLRVDGILDEPA